MKMLLFLLLCFVGITAAISGVLLVIHPAGSLLQLPVALLNGSPFKTYLLPGLALCVVVGGANLLAFYLKLIKHPQQYNWSLVAGLVVISFVVLQYFFIQVFSWLQVLYFVIGLLIVLIAYQLKGKWAV